MIAKLVEAHMVALDVEGLAGPEEVLRFAGDMMVAAGKAAEAYVDEVVAAYRELGPYFVIAPGIALPHTRPSASVYETAVCFVRLKEPMAFGHPENDPVKLVFLLAGTQNGSHLDMIGLLGNIMADEANMEKLEHAKTYEELIS